MMTSLSISNVATYGNQPALLDGLSKFNFIFGANGTGKTTISRVIAGAKGHDHCPVMWAGGTKLQALVYNRDFIDANFNQSTEIKGVFTLGEEDAEIIRKISAAKEEQKKLEQQIQKWCNTLDGEDGKSGELRMLEETLKNKCWTQKQKYDAKLKDAFKGYRNSSEQFKKKVIDEWKTNISALKTLTDLERAADTVFGNELIEERFVSNISADHLIVYETHPVLKKRVLGKADVDIAGMINRLGNSDWVRQGRNFYEKNEDFCPFCQQKTTDNFTESLIEYFDETFETDSQSILDLETNYQSVAGRIQQAIAEIISNPTRFMDMEKLTVEKQLFDSIVSGNFHKLALKKKEPSQIIELDSIFNTITAIQSLVDEANSNIVRHNATVKNIAQERQDLTAQVWKFILEELNSELSHYDREKGKLDSAIASLRDSIEKKTKEKTEKENEIIALEKCTTSIQPTMNGINALLKSFGFYGFSLALSGEDRYYKLIRADGEDAKTTLSEGERTFITFLYFYYLLKGSNSESGITNNRIVVFDDPVSSLDSDILFIVSSLESIPIGIYSTQ